MALLAACARHPAPAVYQYAAFDDFAAGQYAGSIPLSALKTHGDFGLGTFSGLDGEMIVLDGTIYRAQADCTLTRPDPATLSPFAELVFFKPEASSSISMPGDSAALGKWLNARLPEGSFAAVRVKATIKHLKIRSVAGFTPPYPALGDALKSMNIRDLTDATGTIVGLRGPAQPTGVWVPGWHFHFVSADGKTGGHVLNAEGIEGDAAWMSSTRYELELPPPAPGRP
nr:acetolactate decarboxylase [Fundidesulfovibrio terrae]